MIARGFTFNGLTSGALNDKGSLVSPHNCLWCHFLMIKVTRKEISHQKIPLSPAKSSKMYGVLDDVEE